MNKAVIFASLGFIWASIVLMIGYPNTILPGGAAWISARVLLFVGALLPLAIVTVWHLRNRRPSN